MIDENKKIVMIGAGNVATHMALALSGKGRKPIQVWSRSKESACALASLVGCEPVTSMEDVADDADIYIVSVTDNALADVIAALCARCHSGVFVHTAGTMPMALFDGKARHYGVVYPMQTFSKQKTLDFSVIPCFVEASDDATLGVVRQLAGTISERVYDLACEDRRWLHVAAVFACNFSNACCNMAARILEEHGLDFSMMLPLVDETTRKLHDMSPGEAQTGPAARGDHNVIEKHMAMLDGHADLQRVYGIMSEEIERLKKENLNR